MRNPYRPPDAAVDDVVPPPGAPVKAIVYGVLVDVGGSMAAGLGIAILYSIVLAASGVSPEEMQRIFSDPDPLSWPSVIGSLVGGAASFLGGYVCARVAAVREMRSVGVVAAVSGIVSLAMGSGGYAFEWNALLALAGMAAVFAGGSLGTRNNRRRRA